MTQTNPSISSRLVKKEQTRLARQTFLFVAVALITLLGFVFVIMPEAVRLFFKFLDQNTGLEATDTIPPQVPIIPAPVEATVDAKLNIKGYAETESEVVFLLDSQEVARVKADNEGNFSQDLRLNRGENLVELYSVDRAGNESSKTKTFKIYRDDEPPTLEIEEPAPDAQIEQRKNQNMVIKGKTEALAKVYVNDRLVVARDDGTFNTTYLLVEGDNILKFRIVDRAGNTFENEMKVHFKF